MGSIETVITNAGYCKNCGKRAESHECGNGLSQYTAGHNVQVECCGEICEELPSHFRGRVRGVVFKCRRKCGRTVTIYENGNVSMESK